MRPFAADGQAIRASQNFLNILGVTHFNHAKTKALALQISNDHGRHDGAELCEQDSKVFISDFRRQAFDMQTVHIPCRGTLIA